MKVSLTPHQQKFIAKKMENGGYLSRSEVVREALRVYELAEQEDGGPELEAALRHSLRSARKKYLPGHFSALASRNGRRAIAA
jgi:putative addiction module CopG family antidote